MAAGRPIPTRFDDETIELLQFISGPLWDQHDSQADFIREAVEEKLEREGVREIYEAARKAVEEAEGKEYAASLEAAPVG